MDKPESFSAALWAGVLTKVREMERQELGYYATLRPLYDELFPSYLEQMRREFYPVFSALLDKDKPPAMDAVRAKADDTVARWTASLNAQLEAVEDEWLDIMDEELEEASESSWWLALWLLTLQDAEVLEDENPTDLQVPPWPDMSAYLLAGAIGGLTYIARAAAWREAAVEKFRQQLTRLTVTGSPFAEVEEVTKVVQRQYQQGLSALGADELVAARVQAEERALSQVTAGGYARHMWLTRDDELVCTAQRPPKRACAPLHQTITDLRPIYDSHPRCRCITVPIVGSGGSGGSTASLASFKKKVQK